MTNTAHPRVIDAGVSAFAAPPAESHTETFSRRTAAPCGRMTIEEIEAFCAAARVRGFTGATRVRAAGNTLSVTREMAR